MSIAPVAASGAAARREPRHRSAVLALSFHSYAARVRRVSVRRRSRSASIQRLSRGHWINVVGELDRRVLRGDESGRHQAFEQCGCSRPQPLDLYPRCPSTGVRTSPRAVRRRKISGRTWRHPTRGRRSHHLPTVRLHRVATACVVRPRSSPPSPSRQVSYGAGYELEGSAAVARIADDDLRQPGSRRRRRGPRYVLQLFGARREQDGARLEGFREHRMQDGMAESPRAG